MSAPVQRPASNSEARKRMEELRAKRTAPIGVARESGEWAAVCDAECSDPLDLTCASSWHDAYEIALGHACLHHSRTAS